MTVEVQPKGIDPKIARAADELIADHALEISRRAIPTHVSAGVEVHGIELGEAVKTDRIAQDLKKGPSYSPRSARFKNGSHTELQTSTTGSDGISSSVQSVDAEGSVKKLLRTHGESSESFMPQISGKDKQDLVIGADRLRSMYRRLGVSENDAEAHVQVFLGNACKYDRRDPPEVNMQNALGPASPSAREVIFNAFSFIRKKFPFSTKA